MVQEREVDGSVIFDKGQYAVRFDKFSKKDSTDGLPIAELVNWGGEELMIVRYNTVIPEGRGPSGSVRVGELLLLMRAFGCDVSKMPKRINEDTLADALMEAALQLEGCQNEVVVHVTKEGSWLSWIEGMGLPQDETFQFRLSQFTTLNEEGIPCPRVHPASEDYGRVFFVKLEVVGGEFDGIEVRCMVPYAYAVNERGEPTLPTYTDRKTGEKVKAVGYVRTVKFESLFLDDEYDCEDGPSDNVVAIMAKHISNKTALGRVNKYGADLDSMMKPPEGSVPKTQPPLSEGEEEALSKIEHDTIGDDQLRDLMAKHATMPVFKEGTWVFTKDGLAWAKDILAGWSDKHNLPRKCSQWNKAQRSLVVKLLDGELAGREWFGEEEESAF